MRYYRLLTRRLVEPLWKAGVDRPVVPLAAEYQRAAERDLALGELDLAWTHADRALRAASSFRERAQAESLLGNVEYQRGQPGKALPHYRQAAELLQATGDNPAATYQIAAAGRFCSPRDGRPKPFPSCVRRWSGRQTTLGCTRSSPSCSGSSVTAVGPSRSSTGS